MVSSFSGSYLWSLQTKGDLVFLTRYLGVPQERARCLLETHIPFWERRRRVDGPKSKRNKTLQRMVPWSLAWLTWPPVAKDDHHHTTLPSHAESLPLQSSGGMNEHEVLYGLSALETGWDRPSGSSSCPLAASHPCTMHQGSRLPCAAGSLALSSGERSVCAGVLCLGS